MGIARFVRRFALALFALILPITPALAGHGVLLGDIITYSDSFGFAEVPCLEGSCDFVQTTIGTSTTTGIDFTEPDNAAIFDYIYGCNGVIDFSAASSAPVCGSNPVDITQDLGTEPWPLAEDITNDFANLCYTYPNSPQDGCVAYGDPQLTFFGDGDAVQGPVGVAEPAAWALMMGGLLSLLGIGLARRSRSEFRDAICILEIGGIVGWVRRIPSSKGYFLPKPCRDL